MKSDAVLMRCQKQSSGPTSPPPLTTTIQPTKDGSDRTTPRAQTRNEVDPFDKKPLSMNLEGSGVGQLRFRFANMICRHP